MGKGTDVVTGDVTGQTNKDVIVTNTNNETPLGAVGGNNNANDAVDLMKILDSVGIRMDEEKLKKVISKLSGSSKLTPMLTGGAIAIAASSGSATSAWGTLPAAAEKEEKKKEESEECDDDMGFGLFD
uniref:Large ribosomal subunit protein P2 n=1 Tax=Monodelphis domestica TaxID=13616 RepID=A0A5F8HGS1_MONDO